MVGLAITIGAHLFLLKNYNIDSELEKIESEIKTQLSKSEKLIPANLDFDNELDLLIGNPAFKESYSAIKLNVYKGDKLIFWNHPDIIDSTNSISQFLQFDSGQTLSILNDKEFITQYSIFRDLDIFDEEGFLHSNLLRSAKAEYQFKKSSEAQSTHALVLNGIPVFVSAQYPIKNQWKTFICFFLLFLSTFLFLLWHNEFSTSQLRSKTKVVGFIGSLLILVVVRYILSLIDFHSYYPLEQIFHPDNDFSWIHKSVGSAFWNSIFILAAAILFSNHQIVLFKNKFGQFIAGIILYSIPICIFCLFLNLTAGLIFNTDIIIDDEQIISFDKHALLEILNLVSLLIAAFLAHYKVAEITKEFPSLNRAAFFIGAVCLTYPLFHYYISFPKPWMFYIGLAAFYLTQDLFVDTKRKNLPWTIWWIVIYAGFTASLIFGLSFQKRIIERSAYLDTIYSQDNNANNNQILDTKKAILQSGIIDRMSILPFDIKFDRSDLKEFVVQSFDKNNALKVRDDFEVFIYDGYGNAYFSNDFSYEKDITDEIFTSKQVAPDIYYSPFTKNYFLKFYTENENYAGKRLRIYFGFKANNQSSKQLINTNYAVYQNGKILQQRHYSPFAVSDFINFKEGQYFLNRQSIIVKEKGSGIKIISVEQIANLLKPISLFSFFFLFTGIIILLLTLVNSYYSFLPNSLNLQFRKANSLRARLQVMVIALIVVAFMLIGFASFFYFKNILESNQRQAFINDVEKIQKDIYSNNRAALDNEGSLIILSNSLHELSNIHDVDLSLYNQNAQLINTVLVDKKANLGYETAAFFHSNPRLSTLNDFNLSNYTSFRALRGSDPTPFGFLEINHRSTAKITDRLKDFISTILNLYVFLFLLAGALAISVANSITFPLTVLSEKLKQIKLGRKNEILDWGSKDEIGILINEYNSMISKLEESATLLAKTERDHAWKEMAKQVAHEVKNPLTPMKLSVQYLERAVKADPENAEKLISKVSNTLIEQIDTLAEIANSFANLAKMPKGRNEKLIINNVVENVHDLFKGRDDIDFRLILPIDELTVFADRNQLTRILNNLVKNASQSIPHDRAGKVILELSEIPGMALIRVTDNGIGIPEEMRSKVFTPNFTTKSTGTGLGLAMCANMIETINGRIYFDSESEKGTSFYVEIPLMKATSA